MMEPETEDISFRIGNYDCFECLGGNMGKVYRAYDRIQNRPVAVKFLSDDLCWDEELRERFTREGRTACKCLHPNIVKTFLSSEDNGRPYIVMEFVDGETLRDFINYGELNTQEQALSLAVQIAEALFYLEARGIVHRDVKPENIYIDAHGNAKLGDFGVSYQGNSRLTRVNQAVGTPAYMSPEQVQGKASASTSDMYSFGVLLFEMLAVSLPYEVNGNNLLEMYGAIREARPRLEVLQKYQVPAPIRTLVARCLEKEPKDRYKSFSEICRILKTFLASPRGGARPGSYSFFRKFLLLAALAGAAFLGIVIWAVFGTSGQRKADSPSKSATGMVPVPDRASGFKGFSIDRTEVSSGDYLRFCEKTGHALPPNIRGVSTELPVVNVTFLDATAFAAWSHKRLPTAVEWQRAARGASNQRFPWGNDWKPGAVNVLTDESEITHAHLAPVNSFPTGASPDGVLNMIGNAWEWVNTPAPPDTRQFQLLQTTFPEASPPLSPTEPYFQVRGGSFRYPARSGLESDLVDDFMSWPARLSSNDIGFRCVEGQ